MQRTETIQGEKFLDVIRKIEGMTSSQQRFIQEMLSQRKQAPALPKKRILKKSFGLWADRGDIKSSTDYANQLRREWQSRLGMKLVIRNIKHYPMKDVEIVKPY